jgi:hypothetical protein
MQAQASQSQPAAIPAISKSTKLQLQGQPSSIIHWPIVFSSKFCCQDHTVNSTFCCQDHTVNSTEATYAVASRPVKNPLLHLDSRPPRLPTSSTPAQPNAPPSSFALTFLAVIPKKICCCRCCPCCCRCPFLVCHPVRDLLLPLPFQLSKRICCRRCPVT